MLNKKGDVLLMKTKQKIEFFTASEVLTKFEIEEGKTKQSLKTLAKFWDSEEVESGEGFNTFDFLPLADEFNLYYCSQHDIFHQYYYEPDGGEIYSQKSTPVCPLCLLNIDIQG